jgi:hypothetical protein
MNSHSHFAVAYSAIEQQRRTLAADALFGAGHRDSIIQPGIDEVLACRDMLQPAPVEPSPIVRLCARVVAAVQRFASNSAQAFSACRPSLAEVNRRLHRHCVNKAYGAEPGRGAG